MPAIKKVKYVLLLTFVAAMKACSYFVQSGSSDL
jgi:hypothetical protein